MKYLITYQKTPYLCDGHLINTVISTRPAEWLYRMLTSGEDAKYVLLFHSEITEEEYLLLIKEI